MNRTELYPSIPNRRNGEGDFDGNAALPQEYGFEVIDVTHPYHGCPLFALDLLVHFADDSERVSRVELFQPKIIGKNPDTYDSIFAPRVKIIDRSQKRGKRNPQIVFWCFGIVFRRGYSNHPILGHPTPHLCGRGSQTHGPRAAEKAGSPQTSRPQPRESPTKRPSPLLPQPLARAPLRILHKAVPPRTPSGSQENLNLSRIVSIPSLRAAFQLFTTSLTCVAVSPAALP